jgi:hypothetical protein
LWVGRYSQCSFNAIASVLTYFYGPNHSKESRDDFELHVFRQPLGSTGFGAYFGWGPWTSYMVKSGKMAWNGKPVTGLASQRFTLRTGDIPLLSGADFVVKYQPGERDILRTRLLKELARGPVVMWTCYAARQESGFSQPWHHVVRVDDRTDAVPFGPYTHSVTLYLVPRDRSNIGLPGDSDRILVADCSVLRGLFVTDPDTIVATAAAMTGFVRLHSPGIQSVLDRVAGIQNDEYNVVFFPSSAVDSPASTRPTPESGDGPAGPVQPHPTTSPSSIQPNEAAAMIGLSAQRRADASAALARAGKRRGDWLLALQNCPDPQRDGAAFLISNMPDRDLASLPTDFFLENVDLAYKAFADRPWEGDVPDEIFLNDVLPYATLSETRDHWRPDFVNRFRPLVRDCRSASEAALLLNSTIFNGAGVRYNATRRPRPDQSPEESISAGFASCTGLSLMLIDACRAVGVPARAVAVAYWAGPKGDTHPNDRGNHTWVEIWDGQWHVIGASEISPLDQTWFLHGAARQSDALSANDGMDHRVFASNWQPTGCHLLMRWDPSNTDVPAYDVTSDYAGRTPVLFRADAAIHLVLRLANRLIADTTVAGETSLFLAAGQTYDAEISEPGKPSKVQQIRLPRDVEAGVIRLSENDGR